MKKIFASVTALMLAGCSMTSVVTKYTKDEPCVWCDETPTMELTNYDDELTYICKSCAIKCFYCNNTKIERFGFNLLGDPIPMCSDHAEQLSL